MTDEDGDVVLVGGSYVWQYTQCSECEVFHEGVLDLSIGTEEPRTKKQRVS